MLCGSLRFVVVAGFVLVACSSESAAPGTPAPTGAPAADGQDTSGPPTEEDPNPNGSETLDLVVKGRELSKKWALGDSEAEIIVAVQDDTADERVAWTSKTVRKPTDTFELSFPQLLKKGHTYRLALAGITTYALFPIGEVTKEVVLEIDHAAAMAAASKYQEAYDLIDTSLAIPPGTYQAALPANGTSATFIVGSAGRLHSRKLVYGCSGAAACGSTVITSDPTCGRSFVRGDTMTAHIEVYKDKAKLTADVAVEGDALRVKGTMSSASCCSEAIDVLAKRIAADVGGCE